MPAQKSKTPSPANLCVIYLELENSHYIDDMHVCWPSFIIEGVKILHSSNVNVNIKMNINININTNTDISINIDQAEQFQYEAD